MNVPAGGDSNQQPIGGEPAAPVVDQAAISGAPPPPGQRIIGREERIEYRDQDGNLLNEEQVKALQGKVEFKTRYETRTRVVDANGNELASPEEDSAAQAGVAPPHPDVEGADSSTKGNSLVPDEPLPVAKESVEGEKEREDKAARPASEAGNEATAKEEL